MILKSNLDHFFYIKNETSICHRVECKLNYKNRDFKGIPSLCLDTTSKPWVDSFFSVFCHLGLLGGTIREGLLCRLYQGQQLWDNLSGDDQALS
uniref:Uncharacterized protein n=1 Tax=Macaca nemestrina TaxID=9545 RepID=A0A2K6AM42_MACNE